jgi:hypothetical protein
MAKRIAAHSLGRAVTSAPVLGAIALMLLNDHVLKRAGLLPGVVTGKLSDFAFLFFAPIVLAFLTRATTRSRRLACFALPAGLLLAINVSPAASAWLSALMAPLLGMQLWPDPTDLIALASLPVAWWHLGRQPPRPRPASFHHGLVTALAAVSCIATSPAHAPMVQTHEPIYMSWQDLRAQTAWVEPPRPIMERGKILVVDHLLLVSEPRQGVHLFDNRDPKRPVPLSFLRIIGNVDIAAEGDTLYADSFVDLLVFRLDRETGEVELLERLEDQFAYDPHHGLTIPENEPFYVGRVDRSRGVVVGVKKIPNQEVAK